MEEESLYVFKIRIDNNTPEFFIILLFQDRIAGETKITR